MARASVRRGIGSVASMVELAAERGMLAASFIHAFKRWRGRSPGAARAGGRGAHAG